MRITRLAVLPLLMLAACASSATNGDAKLESDASLSGSSPLDTLEPATLEDNLAAARAAFAADPKDETNIIWLGRRLAYLGRYEEAIDVYSRGLELHPESYRLLRHRGHRFITLRRFERAENDLAQAAHLTRGVPDEIEPDGAPNKYGVPRSTNHSNIYYHLGLARYLQGRYDDALEAYEKGLEYSKVNDDMLIATTHWTYTTLRRLGRDDEAQAVLAPIHEDMEVLENHGYHRLLLMYQGQLGHEEVLAAEAGSVEFASCGYGVAAWLRAEGRTDEAQALCARIVDSGANPAAFGVIAAEVDLARP